jgi:vanillate O-demethylase ferredoxin subunit
LSLAAASPRKRKRPLSRRDLVLPVHRWLALTLGLIVLASAVTGAGMAFRKELDPLVYSRMLHASTCGGRLPLDAFVARARAAHPKGQVDYVRVFERADAPVILRFTNKDTFYFDGCNGEVLGQQNRYEGVFGHLEQIHKFAFVPNGGWVMGTGALTLVLALVGGGLVVWWPRRPRRLRDVLKLNTALKGRAFELDLHRTLGAYAAIPLTLSAMTGLPTAFEWVRHGVDAIAGTPVEKAPASTPPNGAGRGKAAKISLEQAWREAQALSPHPQEALLHLAGKARSPIEIFIIGADAPHADARTYLYLDAYSGKVLKFAPYKDMGLGEKIYYWALAVHTGEVGGVFGQFLLFLGALSVPVLAYTGANSYLRRTLGRKPRKATAPAPAGATDRRARIEEIRLEAPGVKSFRLVSADGRPLPPPTPGAHINVNPAPGVVRQYSLLNGPDETDDYRIAVRRDSASRGGSKAMHDLLKVGDVLPISEPHNHFPLSDQAERHLLIARNIGITPILAMAKALAAKGADFRLEYFTRAAENTPFLELLSGPAFAGRVRFHHGLDDAGQQATIEALLLERPDGGHLYVCGGRGFMDMVTAAAADWPEETVHREYFTANPCAWSGERQGFDVTLARSGQRVHVPPELSLVEALAQAGVPAATSCEQGVCGTCLTRVLQGVPDHRDAVLSPLQRERGDCMAICVSRAKSEELVLDL